MTIAIDSVCTHAELAAEFGGEEELENLLPTSWAGSSALARENALRDVLTYLERRTPPVRSTDLADVTQLRRAVCYGALERIFAQAMTTADSVNAIRRKTYEQKFNDECSHLSPTVSVAGSRASAFSFSMERR
jgi:hypothetical protein